MQIQIADSAPGFGPSREAYLDARIRRLVEPYASQLAAVELKVSADGALFEAGIVVRFRDGSPASFRSRNRRMVSALGDLFDSLATRLGVQFPKARPPRDEAM